MKRCTIIGAAPEVFWDRRWTPDLVICADGGSNYAKRLGLKPDVVIGDADSGGACNILLPKEKNATDMEACLDYALEAGCREIALLGASGGRLDHYHGNIGLIDRSGGKAFILDEGHEIRAVYNHPVTISPPHKYRYFSLIPLDEVISCVNITGAKYPLKNATLRRNATEGISNEPFDGLPFTVSVTSGKVLLILSEKR